MHNFFFFLPDRLQLIMEAEAEAESIRVRAYFCLFFIVYAV